MKIPVVSDLLSLIAPPRCHVCGRVLPDAGIFVCPACLASLRRESQRQGQPSRMENQIGSVPAMRQAAAWLTYRPDGASGILVHDIKYHGYSRLARFLGRRMAIEMIAGGIFTGASCLVPVPIHHFRRMRRGYNQSEEIARGISSVTGIPVVNALRGRHHKSQTRLHGRQRIENAKNKYTAIKNVRLPVDSASGIPGVVLVDDVCTTGSTLVNAAAALETAHPGVRITMLVLALTHNGSGPAGKPWR